MKRFKSDTIEYVVLDANEHLKTCHLMSGSGTGWQAALIMDVVKQTCGAWASGENDELGHPLLRTPSADEVVSRAIDIVEMTVKAIADRGWSVVSPSMDDLVDSGGSHVGFRSGGHGKQILP